MTCELCKNLSGLCNLHKPKETEGERRARKALYIARCTAHFDTPQIRKEASVAWDKANEN